MPTIDLNDIEVVKIDDRFSRQARSLLYHAYSDEPTFKYLLDEHRSGYQQRIRATIRELIRLHMDRGETVLGLFDKKQNRLLGVAFCSDLKLTMDISKQFLWRLKMILTIGFGGTHRFIQHFNNIQQSLPPKQHRMVSLIGIHPNFQKQGLGKVLLDAVHAVADEDNSSFGLFLDTANPLYLKFYQSLNYEVYKELKLGDLTEYVLFRPNLTYQDPGH